MAMDIKRSTFMPMLKTTLWQTSVYGDLLVDYFIFYQQNDLIAFRFGESYRL